MSNARQHCGLGGGGGRDKLYHGPGVGSRTGMRFADDAFDLDEFIEAGRRAMKQQNRRSAGSSHVGSDSNTGDSDDESVGTARGVATDIRASSSMLLVNSPGPSPRSTIRRSQAPSSSPFLSSPGTAHNHSPSPQLLSFQKPFARQSVDKSSEGDVVQSMSSPSKIRGPKRKAIATGLEARKEKKRMEKVEQDHQPSRKKIDSPLKASSIVYHSESEVDDDGVSESDHQDEDERNQRIAEDIIAEDDIAEDDNSGDDVEVALQDFEPQSSEGLEQVYISPGPNKTTVEPTKLNKTIKSNHTRLILQEKNGAAIQSSSTALSKARKKAKEGPMRKRKVVDNEEGSDQHKLVEKIPFSYHRQASAENGQGQEEGLRRGSRYRYKPLEYWRGEKARFGRPSLPKVSQEGVGDETIDGDAFEDHFAGSIPLVAVLKEIIRVPREEGEGTFSGMKIRKERAVEPVRKKPQIKDIQSISEPDPSKPTRHAESGWDDSTEMKASVWDAENEKEVELQIACTSSQVRPRLAVNSTFGFEKIFVVDHTLASGILFILVNGQKPLKSSKANNYTFVVLEGAVKIHLHKSDFVIAPHGIFFVPAGNDYSIENICKRTAKIAFTQCRNRTV